MRQKKMTGHRRIGWVKDPDLLEAVAVAEQVLPARLRGLRESQGLTTEEVARDTGVTRQSISAYEVGVQTPSLMQVIVLAAYYGVTVDWLIWDEEVRVT